MHSCPVNSDPDDVILISVIPVSLQLDFVMPRLLLENENMRNDSTKEDVELAQLKKTLSDERMKKEQVSDCCWAFISGYWLFHHLIHCGCI